MFTLQFCFNLFTIAFALGAYLFNIMMRRDSFSSPIAIGIVIVGLIPIVNLLLWPIAAILVIHGRRN